MKYTCEFSYRKLEVTDVTNLDATPGCIERKLIVDWCLELILKIRVKTGGQSLEEYPKGQCIPVWNCHQAHYHPLKSYQLDQCLLLMTLCIQGLTHGVGMCNVDIPYMYYCAGGQAGYTIGLHTIRVLAMGNGNEILGR